MRFAERHMFKYERGRNSRKRERKRERKLSGDMSSLG